MKKASSMISRITSIMLIALLVTTLISCGTSGQNEQLTSLQNENKALKERVEQFENLQKPLLGTAINVLTHVANKDFKALSAYVHPTQGVRFSPYAFVEVDKDIKFSAQDIAAIQQNNTIYTWGVYDGRGNPIELNFADYFNRFVYDADFISPHILGINRVIGQGNTIVNISEAYPNGSYVEFHFTGFEPQYEGIDWRSLFLVFEQQDGKWYLVGVVHNEWTI